jgi:uncharacterized protein YdcH (DUF465 family)
MDLKRELLDGQKADAHGEAPVESSKLPNRGLFQNPSPKSKAELRTVPMDLHHPILREFPEHREIIRRLKGSDDHFRKMFNEYHHLDDAVYRIEEEIDFATDQEIDELKLRRAKLKDYIYHLVRHAPPSCPACEGTGIARPTL